MDCEPMMSRASASITGGVTSTESVMLRVTLSPARFRQRTEKRNSADDEVSWSAPRTTDVPSPTFLQTRASSEIVARRRVLEKGPVMAQLKLWMALSKS